ncbi:hypothetical protein [Secundilactobacillus kimchicus]|uniref:hypothetical protein n=1 Tax=Secundilactobacillus kimchicus TaxID=528209 RepID=UPI0024A967C8|nr:hypothetical protein [Secundilactobacillus kimchicus]
MKQLLIELFILLLVLFLLIFAFSQYHDPKKSAQDPAISVILMYPNCQMSA